MDLTLLVGWGIMIGVLLYIYTEIFGGRLPGLDK